MHIDSAERQEPGKKRTDYDHLAFSLESREEMEARTRRLSEDGDPVLSGPHVTDDGDFESCAADLEGKRIRITVSPQKGYAALPKRSGKRKNLPIIRQVFWWTLTDSNR